MVRYLLQNDVNINHVNTDGQTPLHIACLHNFPASVAICELLLDCGGSLTEAVIEEVFADDAGVDASSDDDEDQMDLLGARPSPSSMEMDCPEASSTPSQVPATEQPSWTGVGDQPISPCGHVEVVDKNGARFVACHNCAKYRRVPYGFELWLPGILKPPPVWTCAMQYWRGDNLSEYVCD